MTTTTDTLISSPRAASFGGWSTDVRLHWSPTRHLLEVEFLDEPDVPEPISIDLSDYGLSAEEGTCWIKDWSEHQGLASSPTATGAVKIMRTATVGPFNSPAHLVRPIFTPEA